MKRLLLPLLLLGGVLTAPAADTMTAPGTAPGTPATAPGAAATAPASAIDPAKEAEIRKMIASSHIDKTMRVVMDQMLNTMRASHGSVSPEFWTRLGTEMDTKDLIERLVPLYDQFFTLDDLKAINAFNASPAGQHMISIQPQLMSAAMQVGQQWGRETAARIMTEVQTEESKTAANPSTPTPSPAPVPAPTPAASPKTTPASAPGAMN